MARYGPEVFKLRDGCEITLRHCQPDDAPLFSEFQKQVARETKHTLQVESNTPPIDKVRNNWAQSEDDPIALRLGVFHKNKLVGQLGFRPLDVGHPWVRHLGQFGMMLLQDYWGKGLGAKMLEVMHEHALKVGVTRIEAMVRVSNQRGLNLYRKAGYSIEGKRKNAAFINNGFQDEYFIAKILTSDSSKKIEFPEIKTDRLLLRPVKIADAESIFEYAQVPKVSQYTLWDPHKTINDSLDFITTYIIPNYAEGVPEPFGITFRDSPEKIIGTVGCFWVSKNSRHMELAYALAEPHWGKGLTVEASRALLSYVFENFEVHRIQARCKVENKASAKVMEKLGMQLEGTLCAAIFHRDRYWDMHYYAVLKDEWENLRKRKIG